MIRPPLNFLQFRKGGLTLATTTRVETSGEPQFQELSTLKPTLRLHTTTARLKCTAAPGGTSGVQLVGVELLAVVQNNFTPASSFEVELPVSSPALPINVLLNQITAWWTMQRQVTLSLGDNLAGDGLSGRVQTVALRAAATILNPNSLSLTLELETQSGYDLIN